MTKEIKSIMRNTCNTCGHIINKEEHKCNAYGSIVDQNSNSSTDQSLFLELNFRTVIKEYRNFRKNHPRYFLFALLMFMIFSFGLDIFSFGRNIFSLNIISIKNEYIDIPMFVLFILGTLTWYKFMKIKRNQTFRLLVEKGYYDFQFEKFDIFSFGNISAKHKKYEKISISTYAKQDRGVNRIQFKIAFEILIDRFQTDHEIIKSNVPNNTEVNIHEDFYSIITTMEYFDNLKKMIDELENFIRSSLLMSNI